MSEFQTLHLLEDSVWLACRLGIVVLFAAGAISLRPARAALATAAGLEALAALPDVVMFVLVQTDRLERIPGLYPDRIVVVLAGNAAWFGLAHAAALVLMLALLARLASPRAESPRD